MKESTIFGIVRLLLVIGAGAGLWMLIPDEQRNELGYVLGFVALVVGVVGIRWLIARLLGRRLTFLGMREIK